VRGQAQSDAEGFVWPNKESSTNSDEWIRLHHNQITQLRPRVLVLTFVNGTSVEETQKKVDAITAAIREATRYHGYRDAKAVPFLDYQVFKIVPIIDPTPLPETERMDGNSSHYPRVPNWQAGMMNFQYSALFSEKFANHYKVKDPSDASRFLTLSEMVGRGVVNEVWFFSLQGNFGAPHPVVEIKQAYDANNRKLKDRAVQAGIAESKEVVFSGRSLRIVSYNAERGAGCALEKLGLSLEAMASSNAVPYFTRYFNEFAGFDLNKRYKTPFEGIHKRGEIEVEYPDNNTLLYRVKGEGFSVRNYVAPAGSVRYCPNSRREFELNNRVPIYSNIENFRMKNGRNGADKAELFQPEKFARYQTVAGDCVGPWMVYWMQSMPGLGSKATDDTDRPMRNWWTFLFY
jgi:hypothetical protein